MGSRVLPRRRLIRGSLGFAGLALLSGCGRLPWQAQVPRVGVLTTASLTEGRRKPQYDAFTAELRTLGYVEGQNVRLEARWSDDQLEKLPELAAELVRLPVDVLITADSSIAQALGLTIPPSVLQQATEVIQ